MSYRDLILPRKNPTQNTDMIRPGTISKICVDCTGLIGDTLLRTPFLESLARLCPDAKIDVVVYAGRETLLRNHPKVSNIFTFYRRNKSSNTKYARQIWSLVRSIRSERYDLYVDLYGGGHSLWLLSLSYARYKLGFRLTFAQRFAANIGPRLPPKAEHLSSIFSPLLDVFEAASEKKIIRRGATFIPSARAQAYAASVLSQTPDKLVLLNLGGGDAKKLWEIHKFIDLSRWLESQFRYSVAVFRNPGQESLLEDYKAQAHRVSFSAFQVIETADFDEIAALLKICQFHVTGDTGYMHLGFGVKCPTVGLFTHTRPEPVWPEDCLFEPCFEPSKRLLDYRGRALGGGVSVETVKSAVINLVRTLAAKTDQ